MKFLATPLDPSSPGKVLLKGGYSGPGKINTTRLLGLPSGKTTTV